MPRPTAAQIAYGSAAVVFSALALLLLTGAEGGIAVAAVAAVALALGLAVSVTLHQRDVQRRGTALDAALRTVQEAQPGPAPARRTGAGVHSLHR
ncbi:hypothetical protein [Streptomyces sp. MUM 178J]|uniref:hypothetical protein n=1 Tax=Streptomyces sp. MUM 178J TaxID=2791991 RepID=UPI001F035E91|nr:hypothetical protein [Streptomyces sp. MUM 178J]WRQ79619.1 hypothetical protein I3F59_009755 [Streptomyces sp. MUM 178J]